MRTVEIPDEVYEEATRIAAAHGQSVEEFTLNALTSRLDEEPIRLTPEQVQIIAEAEVDIDAGRFYTAEQVDEHFAAKRAAWIRENAS